MRAAIRQRLLDGTYRLGTVLPSQRSLAVEFNASSTLIAKALRPFKDAGVLRAHPPSGTVVVGRIDPTTPVPQEAADRRALEVAKRKELAERTRRVIRERLANGQYGPGSQIPTRSALCREFGVPASVLRAALRPLHVDGTLYSVRGLGTYVTEPKRDPRPPSYTPSGNGSQTASTRS
ncbi:GntR family transcriptional regulator [Streptomyces sp. NPDC057621]|uniref:GntR family transcriptional regulator n=1 Tax=Streptomyces sp. NPDC057621 TaxID=3346186 RepID=UPI0036CD37AD